MASLRSMRTFPWRAATVGAAALCGLTFVGLGQAADQVRTVDRTITGSVKRATLDGIVVEERGRESRISPSDVLFIRLEGEPPILARARDQMLEGKFAAASKLLSDIADPAALPPGVGAEVMYCRAACAAGLAMAGQQSLEDALTRLTAFFRAFPDHYRLLHASGLMADVASAGGLRADGMLLCEPLTQAADPVVRAAGWTALGRLALARGDAAAAAPAFERALAENAPPEKARTWRTLAALGSAQCLAQRGQGAESIRQIEGLLQGLPPEEETLHAQAYFTLGSVHEQLHQPREAILAYLHLDVVFFKEPSLHARALKRLVHLWRETGRPERAQETGRILREVYGGTLWSAE